jgi:hypothetical protein
MELSRNHQYLSIASQGLKKKKKKKDGEGDLAACEQCCIFQALCSFDFE